MSSVDRVRKYRTRPHLWLITVIGLLVPRRLRGDWKQEWEAELRHREVLLADWAHLNWRTKLNLLRRSVGAFWDALVLQPRRLEDEVFQDLRYALRTLLKKPGFTFVVVLTLALGIGANTAIFSVINGVLWRPLPYHQPEQLVRVWGANRQSGNLRAWTSYPNLQDWRAQNSVFEKLAAYAEAKWDLSSSEPEKVEAMRITEDFFSTLGVTAAMGRLFLAQEFNAGQPHVVVLSYGFWQRHFGESRQVLGQNLTLEDQPYTIVGVLAPNDLQFPSRSAALWVPLPPDPSRGSRYLNAVGRLKPGVTITAAQAEMSAIAARLEQEHPESNVGISVRLEPLQEALVGDSRRLLLILLSVTGLVLLIACANVTNLSLFRLTERQKELAIRAALGASRLRLTRQLLTESVLLSLLGGTAGLLLAHSTTTFLLGLSSVEIPRRDEIGFDPRVFGFAMLISILPGLLIGLVAAWQVAWRAPSQTLKESGQHSTVSPRQQWLRQALVVTEVALSLMLVIGAGLLSESFWRLQRVNPGFEPQNLLTLSLTLPDSRYPDAAHTLAFYDRVTERLAALSGVQSASIVSTLPLSGGRLCNEVTISGQAVEGVPCAESRSITPNYFGTMGIQLLAGRAFNERDHRETPRVAIINQTLAQHLGPGDAIGKRFTFRGAERQVVGVVADIKHLGLHTDALAEVYLPLHQSPLAFASLVLRTSTAPTSLATAAQHEIWSIDPALPITALKSMEQVIADSVAQPRFRALLLGAFSALALLLAVVGLYGLLAYGVSQRRHEIGIRVALGAQTQNVLRLVLSQGMKLTLIGVAIGLLGASALTHVLAGFLFNVSVTDPMTFAAMSALLMVTAFLACYLPARRATKVDPLTALRGE